MRRFLMLFLLLLSLSIASIGQAATDSFEETVVPTETAAALLKTPALTSNTSQVQLTNIRWSDSIDPVSGQQKLRMVVDLTGPVKAQAAVQKTPVPKLIIQVKSLGSSRVSSVQLDGKIAKRVNVATGVLTSQLVVELPKLLSASDYRVFTLPADEENNKTNRLVIDIQKSGPETSSLKPIVTKPATAKDTTTRPTATKPAVTKPTAQATPITVPVTKPATTTPAVSLPDSEEKPREYHFTAGLRNKVIVLDPGHGGSDPGAIGPTKIMEKDVTLPIAEKIRDLLERAGAKVYLTRTTDVDVYGPDASATEELSARTAVGVKYNADLFISIHANSFTSPSVAGAATYYYDKSNYDSLLAQEVEKAYVGTTGLDDRGIYQEGFYVVKHSPMPAILIELAFISNPREEKLLNDASYQSKAAAGIVQGIQSFFSHAAKEGGKTS